MALVFEHSDYRDYLIERLKLEKRGARQRFAEHLNCQPSFISQVLGGKNELSQEHALKANEFFEHSRYEQRFFMLLVLMSKSGTVELREYYQEQLREVHDDYLEVQSVVQKKEILGEDALFYFNNWTCIGIHLMSSIQEYSTLSKLREKLGVPEEEFDRALKFLTETGLVESDGEKLKTGEAHIHLPKGSPYAQAVILSTRVKMLEKLSKPKGDNVNYSSNFTISAEAYLELRQRILDFIKDLDGLIEKGEPQKFCTMVLDLVDH